jgi:Ca2+/Na+ antiporter
MVDAGLMWCILYLILILLVFVALAIVCDDYLCEAIELLCERYKIPDNVAGASFLALGSAAPEIAISVMAVANAGSGEVKMSLPAIVGSANIAFGLIPPCCIIAAKSNFMALQSWPILRDTIAYSICLGANILFIQDGEIDVKDAGTLTALFFVYMLVVYLPDRFGCCGAKENDEADDNNLEEEMLPPSYGSIQGGGADGEDDEEEPTGCAGVTSRLMSLIYAPFELIFSYTIPDCREEKYQKYWPITFIISIAYVAILSDFVLSMTKFVSAYMGIPASISGATLLALGAQVPDTIASVSMAKKGMADGAISNAIGSQVINVTLGTGLPFLIYTLSTGQDIAMEPGDVMYLAMCLLGVVVMYLFAIFVPVTGVCGGGNGSGLHRSSSYLLLVVFVASNAVFICGVAQQPVAVDPATALPTPPPTATPDPSHGGGGRGGSCTSTPEAARIAGASYETFAGTMDVCMDRCCADSACTAWEFAPAAINEHERDYCYLKSGGAQALTRASDGHMAGFPERN